MKYLTLLILLVALAGCALKISVDASELGASRVAAPKHPASAPQ